MRRIYLSLIMLISSIYASAYDIELNGLYYTYINEGKELRFDSCNVSIEALVIPDEVTYHDRSRSVTAINEKACQNDSTLISLAIPNTVKTIGATAFSRTSISSLIIPSSVTSIGSFAFSGCKAMASIQFGSGVEKIGEYAFMYCTGLKSVILPLNLKTLGHDAFSYCINVESMDIKSGDIQRLTNCPGIKKLIIGRKVTSLNVLDDFSKGSTKKYLDELRIEDLFSWCNINLKNPLPLHEVSEGAGPKTAIFVNDKPITDLTIPEGVTKISRSIFNNWPITGVNIPNSVTDIEEAAFANNHQLSKVVIGAGITSIPKRCFENSLVSSIMISPNIRTIGERAFCGNTFPTITLPNSLREISHMAFNSCKLTSITIPNSVKFVGSGAFSECHDMTKAEINCDTMDVAVFKNDKALRNLTIGNSVKCFATTAIDADPIYTKNINDGQIFAGCPLSVIISYVENPFSFPENSFEKDSYYNASLLIPGGVQNRYKSTDFWNKFIYVEGINNKEK
nr:leucine-rich repeat domain-containing protein [Prevotella sp.]